MFEDTQKILDYLPLRLNLLDDEYLKYLWNSFNTLEISEGSSRSFSIIPFHLLFMMVLQYKIIRISIENQYEYCLAFTIKNSRNGDMILEPNSVFDIASLPERNIPDLLKIIGIKEHVVKEVKSLIDERNDLAHVKGVFERDIEIKISKYLRTLKLIQDGMLNFNNEVGKKWRSEFTEEDDISQFVETRLLDSVLCREDFSIGELREKFGVYIDEI